MWTRNNRIVDKTDQQSIFIVSKLVEKSIEMNVPAFLYFVDLNKRVLGKGYPLVVIPRMEYY